MSMRRTVRSAALGLAAGLVAVAARGDGLHLLVSQPAGPFVISVFTAPTPLRPGTAQVGVLVQDKADRRPVADADVRVVLRAADGSRSERAATARRGTVANRMIHAARVEIPAAGRWTLTASVRAGERSATVSSAVEVAPALAPLVAFWGFIALPFVAIALFALQQWLKHTHQGGGEVRSAPAVGQPPAP
jgi:hypothetical protein